MPRAGQMPRTRAVRALRSFVYFVCIALGSAGAAIVRAAGDHWPIELACFVVLMVVLILVGRLVLRWIDKLARAAHAKDWASLTPAQRSLPFGVIAGDDGAVLLPSKLGIVVFAWVLAVVMVAGGVAMALISDPVAMVFGISLALIGCWTGVVASWITGSRVRLTRDGVESRMGLRRSYRWLDVPELKIDRQIIILKAAGKKRPRVWIRAGVLEASVADCVAMVRRQRGW